MSDVHAAKQLLDELRVEPRTSARLDERDPGARVGAAGKQEGLARLAAVGQRIGVLHNRLFAEATHGLLLVLQGMDTSGKDGTVRSVFAHVGPQGCRVVPFGVPTATDVAHDYLWRVHLACPARGELVAFNRSHYEDVVAARVRKLVEEQVWRRRYAELRNFERLLTDEGTRVVKVFLHLSREEQRARLQERLDNPEKRWKFRLGDLDDREQWDAFNTAYADALRETSTDWSPWYVVPADHNWSRNLAVAEILLDALERLDPQLPAPDPALDDVEVD
jgi:PPK2 family polyphosphate:nucleotide phosphotransferase